MQVLCSVFTYNIYKCIDKYTRELHGNFFNLKLYVEFLTLFDDFRPFQEIGAFVIIAERQEISVERLYFDSVFCHVDGIFYI